MGLFSKFRDTIFLKSDDDLTKQLEELKSIKNVIGNDENIDKDIKILEYGIYGEKNIEFELKNAHVGMYVLHDVTFEFDGLKSQIDYLIFSRGYFYVVECKNMVGNVTVDSTGQFYREYEYNGKRIKESMYSPYTQVVRHCELLKKIRSTGHSKLGNFIIDNLSGMEAFKPLVVFSNSKGILNTKYAPKEIKDSVIRVDQLINYINKDINNISYDFLSSQKDLESISNVWLSRSITNNISIADKYKKLLNIDSKLEERLREFRKQKSKKMNVPAYYIFNDEEMFNIIKYKPKTVEQLTELNIFSKIKLQYHGKDIIDVLNKGDDK